MRDNMTINERMFSVMEQRNVKMADLARVLDINKTVVSAWKKRGTNPPIEFTVQICELLDISIEYYITGKKKVDLTLEEQQILESYRHADPGIKQATRKLLDISETIVNQEESSSCRTG